MSETFQALVVVVRVDPDSEHDAWDAVSDHLGPNTDVMFIGEPWQVAPSNASVYDPVFDTLGAISQRKGDSR